jgi:hypothetical protein
MFDEEGEWVQQSNFSLVMLVACMCTIESIGFGMMHAECLDDLLDPDVSDNPGTSERTKYSTHTIWASGLDRIRSVQAQRKT